MVALIESPYLILVSHRGGRWKIFARDDINRELLQLKDVLFDRITSISIIDSAGKYYRKVNIKEWSVDFSAYKRFPVVGAIVFVFSLPFLSVLVRCELNVGEGISIDIDDAKKIIVEIVERDRYSSIIPKDDIFEIIAKSKSVRGLINNIMRNQ